MEACQTESGTRFEATLAHHLQRVVKTAPTNDGRSPMRDYSLLGPDARTAIERGLASAEWYRTPVERRRMKELMKRRDVPAIRDTVIWIGLMAGFGALGVVWWLSWKSVVCFLLYGVLYGSGGDSRWHECGHGTAFQTSWMNTVVYNVACFMMMREPTVWRWSHTRHHTDTIIVGRDPEIVAMRPPKLARIAANFFGGFDIPTALRTMAVHAVGRVDPEEATYVPESEYRKVFRTARIWLVIYVATLVWAVVGRTVLPILVIGGPRCYGAWHHMMTGLTQHGGLAENVTDHRLVARSVRMNPISRFIYWNMNYHVEHHMFPMVPFHALPALHTEIAADLAPMTPSIAAAFAEFMPVLIRQRRDPDVFINRQLPGADSPAGCPAS
jgi:fatty acid desaturase